MRNKITRSWWPDLLALAAFAALTGALIRGHLLDLDQQVACWAFGQHHSEGPLYWTARILNYLGQGGALLTPVTLVLTALLAWRTRSVRAVLPFVASFVLTAAVIGPAKIFFDRAAPRFPLENRTVMFNPDAAGTLSTSYPSGHVANSLVWYGVIALLLTALLGRELSRLQVVLLRVVPVAIVFVTTVYTGFHWLTDSVAALSLGLILTRLLARIRWDRIPLPPALARWDHPAGL